MKFLLIIWVFDVSGGGMKTVHQDSKVFMSKEACDAAGREMMKSVKLPSGDLRSLSFCLPESVFEDE